MTVLKIVGGALAGLAVLTAVVLGGWQLGWWFNTQNNNRQGHLIRNSYANQQTLRDQITQKMGDVNAMTVQLVTPGLDQASLAAIAAQRHAVLNIVCGDAIQVNVASDPLPPDQQGFIDTNCLDGSAR